MQVIGIKELQTNPGKLTKAFNTNDYALITKSWPCPTVFRGFNGSWLKALVCAERF